METDTKIRKLRELRNYTQKFMAAELNMTTSGYGKIERNESINSTKARKNSRNTENNHRQCYETKQMAI